MIIIWASLIAQWETIHLQRRRLRFDSWVRKTYWRRDRLLTLVFLGFPCGSAGKESACNVGALGSIPGLGRSPEEGKGYPLQFSGLENSMDCIVHQVTKSWTRLSDFDFTYHICYSGQESLRRNGVALIVNKGVWNIVHGCSLRNDRMSTVHL